MLYIKSNILYERPTEDLFLCDLRCFKGVVTDAGSQDIILKVLKSPSQLLGPQRARKLQQKVLFLRLLVLLVTAMLQGDRLSRISSSLYRV